MAKQGLEAAKRRICQIAKLVQKCQILKLAKQELEATKRRICEIAKLVQKCQALKLAILKQELEAT